MSQNTKNYFYKLQTGKRKLSYCCPREAAVVWSDDGCYLAKAGPITVDIDRLITNLYNNKNQHQQTNNLLKHG